MAQNTTDNTMDNTSQNTNDVTSGNTTHIFQKNENQGIERVFEGQVKKTLNMPAWLEAELIKECTERSISFSEYTVQIFVNRANGENLGKLNDVKSDLSGLILKYEALVEYTRESERLRDAKINALEKEMLGNTWYDQKEIDEILKSVK